MVVHRDRFFHAITKRRTVVCFIKRAAISGSSFLRAVLSRRLVVTVFHVTLNAPAVICSR